MDVLPGPKITTGTSVACTTDAGTAPVAAWSSIAVRIVIAVTDSDWHAHLRARRGLAEANFWSPRPRSFQALTPGEFFLFKLKAPIDKVVEGGVSAHAADMPSSLAWEVFWDGKGAASLLEMRRRIARYRLHVAGLLGDFVIGCRILTNLFLWPEELWFPRPVSFSRNIVSFKSYGTEEPEGRWLWDAVAERLAAMPLDQAQPRFGTPKLVRPRLGQGAFRLLVTDRYGRRCAATEERTLPALDAAHIRPFAEGAAHAASNGLLLRRDIHSLFDAGYVTVTPELRFEVSPRIRIEFENGPHYYELQGKAVRHPNDPVARPSAELLRWHNDTVFLT